MYLVEKFWAGKQYHVDGLAPPTESFCVLDVDDHEDFFVRMCIREMKRTGWDWAQIWDFDGFLLYNVRKEGRSYVGNGEVRM